MLPVLCTTIIMSFNQLRLGVGKASLMKGDRACSLLQGQVSGFHSVLFTFTFLLCAHSSFLLEGIHFCRTFIHLRSLFKMFNLIIIIKLYSSLKFSSISGRRRNPGEFYYMLHFTIFGKLNFPSVGSPRLTALCPF